MARPASRSYQSPGRQRQADETRRRIAASARELLLTRGYAGMTVEAIAKEAGVAVPTVYAVFGSKTGILAELVDEATFGAGHAELVHQVMETSDPVNRLRLVARIACNVYASESVMMDLLRGAGVVAPELATLETQRECLRYQMQEPNITVLMQSGRLRAGLDATTARDVLWTLTGRDLYRMMVRERGWLPEKYEEWLVEMLINALLYVSATNELHANDRALDSNP